MSIFLAIIIVFLGVGLLSFLVMYMLIPTKTALEERLDTLAEETVFAEEGLIKPPGPWERFLEKLGRKVPLRPHEYGKYTRMLVAAGIRGERVLVFVGLKVLLAVVLPVIYLFYGVPLGIDLYQMTLAVAILGIGGYLAPSFGLLWMRKKRQLKIFHELPDVLDLMTVCVEAGMSIDASMIRISEDKQYSTSPLAKEMKRAVQETRAGKPRHESLRDMGLRSMEDDLKAFSAMLVQTERLGTSLADSLRIHSDSLRTKRRQVAEEQAAKTTVKLVFPLVFFLFPSMFVVVLVPALIRLTRFLEGL